MTMNLETIICNSKFHFNIAFNWRLTYRRNQNNPHSFPNYKKQRERNIEEDHHCISCSDELVWVSWMSVFSEIVWSIQYYTSEQHSFIMMLCYILLMRFALVESCDGFKHETMWWFVESLLKLKERKWVTHDVTKGRRQWMARIVAWNPHGQQVTRTGTGTKCTEFHCYRSAVINNRL